MATNSSSPGQRGAKTFFGKGCTYASARIATGGQALGSWGNPSPSPCRYARALGRKHVKKRGAFSCAAAAR